MAATARCWPAAPCPLFTERKSLLGTGLLDPGLYVKSVSGSAQLAGLRFGDMLLAVNDVSVSGQADFDAAIKSIGDDETVALLIMRGSPSGAYCGRLQGGGTRRRSAR